MKMSILFSALIIGFGWAASADECQQYPEQAQFIGKVVSSTTDIGQTCNVDIYLTHVFQHYACAMPAAQVGHTLQVILLQEDNRCPEADRDISGVLLTTKYGQTILEDGWL